MDETRTERDDLIDETLALAFEKRVDSAYGTLRAGAGKEVECENLFLSCKRVYKSRPHKGKQ